MTAFRRPRILAVRRHAFLNKLLAFRQLSTLAKTLSVLSAAVVVLLGLLFTVGFLVNSATATKVTFINDRPQAVTLPDCSTDIATIQAGLRVRLPVASDHPHECTVDDSKRHVILGCITLPDKLRAQVVIRMSEIHPCA